MGQEEGARYRAFISYSHVDQAFGRRLHRRLERYVLPKRLVGRETPRGPVPRRVAPVFRDREEFSAAGDLTAEVRAALAASGALIVVCSPASAASPWVGREIELFRELHPGRPVLAAIATGEPAQCFPAALTIAGGAPVEPLAADFRAHADGPRLGLLKLVAGVVGVGLDELVQRDAPRRLVAVTAVTAGAVAVALTMSALTAFALLASREAERQRGQAEALVEFMLTDLRDRLKGVGRLDVLTTVNERTLAYYAGQDVDRLPAASQTRYARILHAMGEDDLMRRDRAGSRAKFDTADRITARLLANDPADPERVWEHVQSEYWLGYHDYLWGERSAAAAHWRRRLAMARALAARAPRSAAYRREVGYGEGDLCALALRRRPEAATDGPPEPRDPKAALEHCSKALSEIEASARVGGRDAANEQDLINRHSWLARAHSASGDTLAAMRERLLQERILNNQIAVDSRNQRLRATWVILQKEIAGLEVLLGERDDARSRLLKAKAVLDELLAFDPDNAEWAVQRDRMDAALAYFERAPQ